MPDILIRGMEMPERCDAKCPLYNTGRGYFDCVVTKQYYNWGFPGRPSDCPLVELPEHGDLISKQAALAALYSDYAYAAMDVIEEVPVVVPAERREP